MNAKSLWALSATLSLIVTVIGAVRFAVDLWNYHRAANAGLALNYRGLGGMLSGAVIFTVFIFLYLRKK